MATLLYKMFITNTLAHRLVEHAGPAMTLYGLPPGDHAEGMTVTTRTGEPDPVIGREAFSRVVEAPQAVVVDPACGRNDRQWSVTGQVLARPVPPPGPTPVWCTQCGCSVSDRCRDDCNGVVDRVDGRCTACINPESTRQLITGRGRRAGE